MGEFLQDVRVGARQLARRPGFAVAAIGSLALGIGVTTTLFTVVNAVLLKASPLRAPERLVELYSAQKGESMALTTSYLDYQSLVAEVPAFSAIAANAFVRGVLSTGSKPLLVTGEAVSANYFDVLGVPAALGRGFRADEGAAPGSAAVVVVSHGLWVRHLGGRPDVVGTTVKLSGVAYAIVGVAPDTFPGTMPGIATDFWVPLTMIDSLQFTGVQWTGNDTDPGTSRLDRRSTRWLFLKGRLADGQTIAQARAQAEALYARLSQQFPRHQREGGGQPGAGCRHPLPSRCSTATCAPRVRACWARSAWSCSLPAPTWRRCCSRAARPGAAKWRCARPLAPVAPA